MSILLALLLASAQPVAPPPPTASVQQPTPNPRRGDAYFEFLKGRHLEGEGEIDAAVEAYRRAVALDPSSAEIQAELAGLYARQNKAEEAIAAAQASLAADPENAEAHWVLGTVYAALAQGNSDEPPAATETLDKAILHLEKARPERRYDLGLALALGRLYLRKSSYDKAIESLKWLTDQEPGAPEVWLLLAEGYEGGGRRGEAIEVLQRVVGMEPRYFRAWVMLGDLLDKERRFADAAAAYERAVAQSPKNTELRLRQATSMLNAGQTVAARSLLERIVADAPTEGGALYLLSEAQRQAKEFDAAEATAKRLVALEPSQLRGAYALAQVYDSRREHRKVIDTLQRFASGDAATPVSIVIRLALAHQELGEFDRALPLFERIRDANPSDPVLAAYLVQGYLAAGRPARALEVAERERAARPDDYRFTRLAADAMAKTGKVTEAVALLQDAVKRLSQRPDVHLGLAALCVEHKQYECARTALDRADRQFPGNVLVPFQRGAMLEQQKQFADAEAAFREALTRDPLHGPTLNYLGYMFAERGERLDEAVSLLQRALETDPWNGSYLDSLGWAHFVRGDLEAAEKYLGLAAERLPMNSVVQMHFGDVLVKRGNKARAIAAWEQALKGDRESIEPDAISRRIAEARRP